MMRKNVVINAGFVLALAVLASIIFMSHWYTTQWAVFDQREQYTFTVIQELDKLIFALNDVRSSQRGFSRTGKKEYLDSFRHALENVEREMISLRILSNGHPWLQKRLAAIEPLVKMKLAQRQELVVRRSERVSSEHAGRGNGITAKIRTSVVALQDEAMRIMREASSRQDGDLRKVQHVLVVNGIIIFSQHTWPSNSVVFLPR